jgi:hypothetical protein
MATPRPWRVWHVLRAPAGIRCIRECLITADIFRVDGREDKLCADEELYQIHDWLPPDPDMEPYVLFNNVPWIKDVRRFRELGFDVSPEVSTGR